MALNTTVGGAKIILSQLSDAQVDARALIEAMPEAVLFILYRRASLERYVSLRVATKTGQWRKDSRQPQRDGSEPLQPRLQVSESDFWDVRQHELRWYRTLLRDARNADPDLVVVIAYEDLLASTQTVFDYEVFPRLGLPSYPISTNLQKQASEPLEAVIENFKDVAHLASVTLDLDTLADGERPSRA